MSNDSTVNVYDRLFKLQAMVGKLILDGKRNPDRVADCLQELVDKSVIEDKFILQVDMGILTVPEDYDHGTQLLRFHARNRGKFAKYSDGCIVDQNFSHPSRILRPGDNLRVRAYDQSNGGWISSDDRLTFLTRQGGIYTGIQGASLVFEQKRDQMRKGCWYGSMDIKDNLLQTIGGRCEIPSVGIDFAGKFFFSLSDFEDSWHKGHCLLCFNEIK